VVRRRFINFVE